MWGRRLEKYRSLAEETITSIDWIRVDPTPELYLFSQENAALRREYDDYWKLTEIQPTSVLGFQSHRDEFAFDIDKKKLTGRINEFMSTTEVDLQIANRFFPGSRSETAEARDRRINAVADLRKRMDKLTDAESHIARTSYFPFDDRWCMYDRTVVDRPRRELVQHVYRRENICLNVVRQTKHREWRHVLVSSLPTTPLFIETKDGSYVFPLFLYTKPLGDTGSGERLENISAAFRRFLDGRYEQHYTPEEIQGYIYAVLHAPTYRQIYAEFLRIDFPRIPFPNSAEDFDKLSKLGWALIQAHLLKELPRKKLAVYQGKGDHTIEAVRYSPQEQATWINKSQFFQPVPPAVWNFHIGGYQVLEKYLKSRKDRRLSLDEISHISAVADSLAFTIEQIERIDKAYLQAFPDRG